MSADLVSDPAIFATYNELRNPDSALNWLLLGYCPTGSKDRLELAEKGDSGLEGLKAALSQSNALNIHFGLLRLEGRFLLFTLLPDNTGGVKRARALVHSRAVGTKLQHQATLTIARPADLTLNAVRSKLRLDTGSASSSLPPSPNPQISAGSSSAFMHLQPSPLRSHFPTNEVHGDGEGAPPPPPDKDDQSIMRMRSNNSLRTPQMSTPPFSPPMRQSSREGNGSTSPQQSHHSPPINGQPEARTRQLSTASTSSANASGSVGLGLGSSVSSMHSQQAAAGSLPHSASGYSHTSTSPRLASLEFEREHRRLASPTGPASPTLANIPESNTRLTPRSSSPYGSASSRTFAADNKRPEDQPLPLSASPSIPTSGRSLEASTIDSMFRPSESYESLDDRIIRRNRSGKSSPDQNERIAVAEAIARAAEAKWQAEQKRQSVEPGQEGGSTNGQGDSSQSNTTATLIAAEPALNNSEADARGITEDPTVRKAEQQQRDQLLREVEEERTRLEEEARQRAQATREAESQRQQAEDDAKRLKEEQEAEVERQRLEAEAEAERQRLEAEAEAERQRLEAEAEAERARIEAEAEAERKRQEEEAEAERLRQEAIAAEEAERKRIEDEKIAAENARLEAIETAKREKEDAREKAREGVRERVQSSSGDVALTGFVSVQGGSSILWRRRYFHLTNQDLKLFRTDKDTTTPVDEVRLASGVKNIEESAEELLAIPHSFKLVFDDLDEEPYLFYCDEEDDKDLLIFGLRLAAKLQ